MAARIAYKAMYLDAHQRERAQRNRTVWAEGEIHRLRRILADHAEKETLPEIKALLAANPQLQTIVLYPLSYEAFRAWLKMNERWTDEEVPLVVGFEALAYKDRKVICQP